MRIEIRKENRKSIAYSLAPEVLTIMLPSDGEFQESYDQLTQIVSEPPMERGSTRIAPREELKQIFRQWADKLQVSPNRVQIRDMKNKWASCSPRENVNLNSLLSNMPSEFSEYVVCHELLHLKVRRHNRLFKSLLSAYMPDWKDRVTRTVELIIKQGKSHILSS